MLLSEILKFIAYFLILSGFYKIVSVNGLRLAYRSSKFEGETFLNYMIRISESIVWRLRKFSPLRRFYISKHYFKISILLGVCKVWIGITILVMVFIIRKTEFGIYLDILI